MVRFKLPTVNRWFTYIFGLLICSCSGVSYMFGGISPSIKENMGYSQYEINMVGTMANLGGNLAIVGSLFYNFAGTRPSCLFSGISIFVGYFLVYAGSMKWIWVNYIAMGFFFMVMQNGTATAYTTALSTNILNFSHKRRGIVVGSMASLLAISSAIFTTIFSLFFSDDINGFMLFMAIAAGSIPTISTIFMNVVPREEKQHSMDSTTLAVEDGGVKGEGAVEDSSSEVEENDDEEEAERQSLNIQVASGNGDNGVVVSYGTIANNGAMYDGDDLVNNNYNKANNTLFDSTEKQPLLLTDSPLMATTSEQDLSSPVSPPVLMDPDAPAITQHQSTLKKKKTITKDKIFREVTPLRMILTLDFWLMLFVFFASVGSVIVINNNLGSIVLSLGGKKGAQNPMILFFAFSNCLGRIIAGWFSDRYSDRVSRITLFNFASLGVGLTHYGFSFATVPMMYPLNVALGLSCGALYAMIPSYMSERFGQKYFSINFSIARFGPSAGSYLLSTWLASRVYQANAKAGSLSCYGRACYQATHLICTGLCVVAFIVGLILMYRSSKMYRRIAAYNKKFGTPSTKKSVK